MEQKQGLELSFPVFSYVSALCLFNICDMAKHESTFREQGSVVPAILQTQRMCLPGKA